MCYVKLSNAFTYNAGVKQGDGLSTLLFNLTLHQVVNKINKKGIIYFKSSQICAYADDIVIVTRNISTLKQIYLELEKKVERYGLVVNKGKTKYMVMSTSRTPQNINIGNRTLEGVSQSRYLEALVNSQNEISDCIKDRIEKRNKAYFANLKLFKSKLLTRNTKVKIYRTLVRPVVTYGSETWTLKTGEKNALRCFERKILRRTFGPVQDTTGWRIRYKQELDRLIEGQDIVRFIKVQRLRWLGHVERMPETQMPKRMLKGRLDNRRRRGRPRMRWIEDVMADLARMGIRGWRIKAANREVWRAVVNEAKTHQGL
jgi:hypothetical protein